MAHVSLTANERTEFGNGSARRLRKAGYVPGVVYQVGGPSLALSLSVTSLDLSRSVGLVFAVAASTLCPLLVLGIWWRGLTAAGAAAGMVLGGLVSGTAAMVVVLAPIDPERDGWLAVLVGYPAAVSVPLAFLAMVLVSLATRRSVPADVGRTFSRMHVPERLGMGRDREIGAFGAGTSGADKSVSGDRTRRSSR